MTRRLHRSLIFWAGIVVMISVCWAWWDSRRNLASLRCGDYAVCNVGGGVAVARLMGEGIQYERTPVGGDEGGLLGSGLRAPVFLSCPVPERDFEMRPHLFSTEAGRDRDPLFCLVMSMLIADGWLCYVPCWLIAAVVGIVWGVCLGWRWWRMRTGIPSREEAFPDE